MRDVIVLGGGASVMHYNLRHIEERGYLIAVNDAALYTKCDAAFTMDRLWLEGRQRMLHVLQPPAIYYRRGTPKNFVPPQSWVAYEHSDGYPIAMCMEQGKLNGSNSGTCAINLAFQLKPKRVFLLGFDMQHGSGGELHWYPNYPWGGGSKNGKLREWASEFGAIAGQFQEQNIQVFNVNHRSLINSFPVIPFDEFLRVT